MKKLLIVGVVMAMVFGMQLQAEKGRANLFAGVGIGVSDFEGIAINVGGEMGFTDNIWGQVVIDYYPAPAGEMPDGVSVTAFNIAAFGVYKHKMGEKLNIFGKAGIVFNNTSVSGDAGFFTVSESDSGIGFGFGGGVELLLDDKKSIGIGFDYYSANGGDWGKIYGNFSIRVK